MTKHTAGRWSIDGRQVVSDGAAIAEVFDGGFSDIEDIEVLAANLKLISAAPELLEALMASHHIKHALPNGEECLCSQCEFIKLRDAAIAKATGEA